MTPQEAIETLKIAIAEVEWNYPMDYTVVFENAISALEKQTLKKPILDTIFPSGVKWWRCPVCKHNNIETNDSFCHQCGQALDWGDCE